MPKLWEDTIETHRRSVREAALDAVGALVSELGLRGVTMSAIAERTGIGRATLYRYFSDADAILAAWHERQVAGHIGRLSSFTEGEGSALERLEALLTDYAQAQHAQPRDEIGAALHGREHVAEARQQLAEFVSELIGEAAVDGLVRADVNADELAEYCLHAMAAAGELRSKAAVRRLVRVTMAGLQPPQIPPAVSGESG